MSRKSRIEETLTLALAPLHLEVWDESHMHSVPVGSESHYNVFVVSDAFAGLPLIARHRQVNALLQEELAGGMHALALHTVTPEEWMARGDAANPASPPCLGGSKVAG